MIHLIVQRISSLASHWLSLLWRTLRMALSLRCIVIHALAHFDHRRSDLNGGLHGLGFALDGSMFCLWSLCASFRCLIIGTVRSLGGSPFDIL